MEKSLIEALDTIDEINPYATYLSDNTLSRTDDYIDTGSYVLNGIVSGKFEDGGIPVGRMTMLAGESMTGKSIIVQKIIANAQKKGIACVIFDTENAIDPEGATRLGIDIKKIKYVPCITIEQTRNAIYKLLTTIKEKGLEGKILIAIDSLGNLQSELELTRMGKDSTSGDMGTKARAIKSLLQTCINLGTLTRTTIVCTNHVYDDPSALFPSLEKHMTGGKAAIYLPSVTIQLARKPMKDDGGKTIEKELTAGQKNYSGVVLRALTRKNRLVKQYLEGEMYLSFATGFDKYFGLLDLAVGFDIIEQTGSTYSYKGTKIGYYKNWRKDETLWKEILKDLQEKANTEWQYSSITIDPDEEE